MPPWDAATADGMTLRPLSRPVLPLLLPVWLVVWAATEYYGIKAVAALFGFPSATPFPSALPSEAIWSWLWAVLPGGMLLAVALWTWGGLLAIRTLLRHFWGRDDIRLEPAGLRVRRNFGLFTRETFYAAERPLEALLRVDDEAVILHEGRVEHLVTTFGKQTDRRALRAAIEARYAFTPGRALASIGKAFEIRVIGTTCLVRRTRYERRKAIFWGAAVIAALAVPPIWIGVTGYLQHPDPSAGTTISLGLFALTFGLLMIGYNDEWTIQPDELRNRFKFGPFVFHSWVMTKAVVSVTTSRDYDNIESFHVSARSPDGNYMSILTFPFPSPVLAWGRLVSHHTGWPLEIDESIVSNTYTV